MANPLVPLALAQGGMAYKGNRAAAQTAERVAARDAEVVESEAIMLARAKADEESRLRRRGEFTKGTARVAVSKSGIQMKGQPLNAMAELYFGIEEDASRIQYASDLEQIQKQNEAENIRIAGGVRSEQYKQKATMSLLGGAAKAYEVS